MIKKILHRVTPKSDSIYTEDFMVIETIDLEVTPNYHYCQFLRLNNFRPVPSVEQINGMFEGTFSKMIEHLINDEGLITDIEKSEVKFDKNFLTSTDII